MSRHNEHSGEPGLNPKTPRNTCGVSLKAQGHYSAFALPHARHTSNTENGAPVGPLIAAYTGSAVADRRQATSALSPRGIRSQYLQFLQFHPPAPSEPQEFRNRTAWNPLNLLTANAGRGRTKPSDHGLDIAAARLGGVGGPLMARWKQRGSGFCSSQQHCHCRFVRLFFIVFWSIII